MATLIFFFNFYLFAVFTNVRKTHRLSPKETFFAIFVFSLKDLFSARNKLRVKLGEIKFLILQTLNCFV